MGASALPDDLSWTVPHALSAEELRRMIADFAQSAQRLQRCGFSGVEISAGHGHLFHQFLSPWSNARDDEYGGDLEGRTRFLAELIGALRATCGREFIVGVKLPGNDGVRGGIGPEEAASIARHITRAGNVDYVCFAQGSHARARSSCTCPTATGRARLTCRSSASCQRATCGVPVVALGRITDPAEADSIIERGDAELVALGPSARDRSRVAHQGGARPRPRHPLLRLVQHVLGHDRHAASADRVRQQSARRRSDDEVDWWPAPAPVRKRVVVVGAGVAGMEAAWVAAARGHHVTVFGRSSEVGGKTRLRAQLPGGEALSSIYDYQHAEAIKAGARFELGVTVGAADVIALKPDAVVLACGAEMLAPRWLPREVREASLVPDLRSAMAALRGHAAHQPGTAVIFDMDHTEGTYAAAELLHALFDRVVLITPRESIAQDAALVTRQGILRRFHEKRIETIVFAEPRWSESFEDGTLEYVNVYNGDAGAIEDVAFLAYSTPRAPQDALAAPLRAAGIDVRLVGDCLVARAVIAATAEGHRCGQCIRGNQGSSP